MYDTYIADTGGSFGPADTESTINTAAAALFEAADLFDDGWMAVGGDAAATHTGGPWYRYSHLTSVRDRSDGRYLPFFETEIDLKRIRSATRRLSTFTSIAVGLKHALEVYVMGGQWRHEARARKGVEPPEGLIDAVQRVIDDNLERNDFVGDLDRELHNHSREDGDALLAIYPAENGLSDWRRLDADNLTEPHSTNRLNDWLDIDPRSSWAFGVLTLFDERMQRVDHSRHAGYHVVFNDSGSEWNFLPRWPQSHIGGGKCAVMFKHNTPRDVKRGLSDYLPIQTALERESKLCDNLSVGAAILAAIPWLEEMPEGVSREGAQQHMANALDSFSKAVANNRRGESGRSRARIKAGTIPKISNGTKYIAGPMGQMRQPIYIEVGQHLLRRIGIAFLFPEYMISGDASNANFSSTLVAESPFVKARQSDQDRVIRPIKRAHWCSLRIAFMAGRFAKYVNRWQELQAYVDLYIEGPEVASRDKAALLNEVVTLFDRDLMDGGEVRSSLDREELPKYEGVTGSSVGAANPRMAAIAGALESVQTTEEAIAILESLDGDS